MHQHFVFHALIAVDQLETSFKHTWWRYPEGSVIKYAVMLQSHIAFSMQGPLYTEVTIRAMNRGQYANRHLLSSLSLQTNQST